MFIYVSKNWFYLLFTVLETDSTSKFYKSWRSGQGGRNGLLWLQYGCPRIQTRPRRCWSYNELRLGSSLAHKEEWGSHTLFQWNDNQRGHSSWRKDWQWDGVSNLAGYFCCNLGWKGAENHPWKIPIQRMFKLNTDDCVLVWTYLCALVVTTKRFFFGYIWLSSQQTWIHPIISTTWITINPILAPVYDETCNNLVVSRH